ncbi:hypothetical protein, partial [Burkholderia ubonensis]|uniref:hypothetical protein n=1 Tax=Burkholderia ubonensis TaxID=101571 RepID=UPI001E307852
VLCHVLLHTGKKLSNFLLYVESGQGQGAARTVLDQRLAENGLGDTRLGTHQDAKAILSVA